MGAICVALGAGLARGARKGRRLPPYSIARTGECITVYLAFIVVVIVVIVLGVAQFLDSFNSHFV